MKITPAEASRLLRGMKTTGPSREADRWADLLKEQPLYLAPATVRVTSRLKQGQWRLNVWMVEGGTAVRRRRMVRVATLKYRARKRRR